MKTALRLSAWMFLLVAACGVWSPTATADGSRRGASAAISVANMVEFATIGDPGAGLDGIGYQALQDERNHRSEFSPDGKRVAIILYQPNLATNSVRGDVLVFNSANLLTHPVAKRVATFFSTSNRPPVSQLRWLADNRMLTAIGEYAGQLPQVYRIDTKLGAVVAVTSTPTGVGAYATTPDGKRVAFLRTVSRSPAEERYRKEHGYVIAVRDLSEAISGTVSSGSVERQQLHLFIQDTSSHTAHEIPDPEDVGPLEGGAGTRVRVGRCRDDAGVSLSPDGRFAIRTCTILRAPRRWDKYGPSADSTVARGLKGSAPPNWRNQDVVFDLKEHSAFLAWDAPLPLSGWERPMAWLPGEHTAVFANVKLPLHGRVHAEGVATVTLDLATGAHEVVTAGAPVRDIRWDGRAGCLSIELEKHAGAGGISNNTPRAVCYRRRGSRWGPVAGIRPAGPNSNGRISLTVQESDNSAPLLVARNSSGELRHVVLDPNPWLHGKHLGLVQRVTWKSKSGRSWVGGLYYPLGFVRGKRYPLVIQTHGFDPNLFSLNGWPASPYAAQPLAAYGILVLQVDDGAMEAITDPVHEGSVVQAGYEGAIDYLDSRGLIDRDKVGITGWSHSCFLVRYFLTHSHRKVAAAVTSDGYDAGYVQFIAFGMVQPYIRGNIGVTPWDDSKGSWVDQWLRESPDFRLERVEAPVRVEALEGANSLIAQWEFYSGLRELHKPVELYYQPDGAHEAVLPQYRLGSAQGTVDWFRFWLQGQEDRDPRKAAQYARWKQLRLLWEREHDPQK